MIINQRDNQPFKLRSIIRHIALLLLFMKCVCPSFAQSAEVKNFIFYSQKDGLSNYNIHKIIQDDKKFLWIATQDGLNRFDGHSFTVYNKGLEKQRALLSNDIRDLVYDTLKNILWAVCNEGGINGIDIITGNVVYQFLYHDKALQSDWRICAAFVDGNIYIGTSGGLEVFNIQTRTFANKRIAQAPFPLGCRQMDIRAVAVDNNQNLWLAAKDKGIIIYNPVSDRILQIVSSANFLKSNRDNNFWPLCFSFVENNACWLGTKNGVLKLGFDKSYQITSLPFSKALQPIAEQEVNHLLYINNHLLISGNTLYSYDATADSLHTVEPADKDNQKWLTDITYCYSDSRQNLWLGCKQGLGQMKNTSLAFVPVRNSKQYNDALSHVYSLCVIDSHQLLAGTRNGLYLVDGKERNSRQLQAGFVQNIVRIGNSKLIVSGNNGIRLFDEGNLLPVDARYPEFRPYKNKQLNSAARLNDSITVLGTESNDGTLIWNTKQHTLVNLRQSGSNSLLSDIVNTVFVNKAGQVIVLSDFGITVIDGKDFKTRKIIWKNPQTNLPLGLFMDITETPENYWVNAYGEGLMLMDKSFRILRTLKVADGLSNTGLYKIFNYKDSLLFVTSNNGITEVNCKTKACRRYFEEDGLQNNTFEEACGDIWSGRFYAGGVEGYTVISPSDAGADAVLPDLYFTSLNIQQDNQQQVDTSNLDLQQVNIPADAVQTNIYFSGIDFINPKRVQYAYRIPEREKDWISLNTQSFISLVGLSAGTYTLQVKAGYEDGLWSKPKQLQLVYLPKWYETIWFDMAAGVCIAFVLYGFYRYRINEVKQQQLIRRNIASDLHDDLGSTLNTMKVFTHLAQKNNHNLLYLSRIESSVTEAIAGLRDMIWVLDDSRDTLQAVMDRIVKITLPVTEAQDIRFEHSYELTETDVAITKTEKRNLLLMLKEIINNSIKYSDCKTIRLQFKKETNRFVIDVSDDGKGFEPGSAATGNGLQNLQYRAAQIRFRVTVLSAPGRGTVIKIIKNNSRFQ